MTTASAPSSPLHQALALRRAAQDHRQANPGARARDVARTLGVSEGELVAAQCGERALRLRSDWPALLNGLASVGTVMALTRNEFAVLESVGVYAGVSLRGPMGVVHSDGPIDLRLFLNTWKHLFALTEEGREGPRQSLQLFDAAGQAVHKIYAKSETAQAAWEQLLATLRHEDQSPGMLAEAAPAARPEAADASIDRAAFRAAWAGLKDTHEFYGLLGRFGVTRTQALRLADPELAWPVANTTPRTLLEAAARQGLPIMIFVGNAGCLQIHCGAVQRVVGTEGWINVLDPTTNLHLREAGVTQSWIVRKPTTDGVVTALECYDSRGEQVVQFFGLRKPGAPELETWRTLAHGLPRLTRSP